MKTRGLLLPTFIFALILAIFFREALFTGKVLYFRDLFSFFIPARRLITTMVFQGAAPWWNPYLFSGVPLAADVVHGIFYPLSAIFYLLPIHWAFKVFVIGHYLVAGVAFYLLMRHWRVPGSAAIFGGVAYMLSGYLLSLSNVLNFLPGAAWLPLALASFLKAMEPGGWRWIFPTGFVLALQVVTDPQSVYFSVCLMGLWALLPDDKRLGHGVLRAVGVIGAAGATAALLAAVQLIPLLELYPRSVRSDGVPLSISLIWSFRPSRLIEFLAPDLYGDVMRGTYWGWIFQEEYGSATPWLLSAYMGVAPLVLGAFAVVSGWKDRRVRYGAVLFLLSLLLAVGDSTPLYSWFHRLVPFFHLFRFPSKWMLLVTWALAALGAMGLARFAERRQSDARRTRRFLVAGLLAGLGLALALFILKLHPELVSNLLARHFRPDELPLLVSFIRGRIVSSGLVAVGLLVATLLLLYGMFEGRLGARLAQAILFLLLTGDLVAHNDHLIPLARQEILETTPPLARVLRDDPDLFRVYRLDTKEEDNLITGQRTSIFDLAIYRWYVSTLYSNTGMDHRLFELWGLNAARLSDYQRAYVLVGRSPLDLTLLGAWNVKYLIVPVAELHHPLLEPVPIPGGDPRIHLYRNLSFLPRPFWVPKARWFTDRERLFKALAEFDPSREVLLEGVGEPAAPRSPRETAAHVKIVTYRPNEVVIRCAAPAPGFLVLSDTYYPGWRVTMDGQDRPLLRANYTMRAVRVDAGTHEIRFIYTPWSLKIGGLVSLVALLLFGGLSGATFCRRKSQV